MIPLPSGVHWGRSSVALLPLVALAAYGLWLRVDQHGWTPERIFAAACVLVAACYALGYLVSAALSGLRLRGLEATNVATFGAQAPSDAPHLLGFYGRYFHRQGSFPVLERDL